MAENQVVLRDKVVVVSGASRGIGKAIVHAFAAEGAKVVLLARNVALLEEEEDVLLASGADAMAIPTDITDEQAIQAVQREVREMYGAVDILVNNAAIATLKPLVETTPVEWEAMTVTNMHAVFRLSQLFLPEMIERRSGVIINMSAALARNGFPNLAVYSATKAALLAFSEALAKEVRRYGVLVYAVCPHGVATGLYQTLFGQAGADKLLAPEYVAGEIVKLAAGESGLRSGQTLDIARE